MDATTRSQNPFVSLDTLLSVDGSFARYYSPVPARRNVISALRAAGIPCRRFPGNKRRGCASLFFDRTAVETWLQTTNPHTQ